MASLCLRRGAERLSHGRFLAGRHAPIVRLYADNGGDPERVSAAVRHGIVSPDALKRPPSKRSMFLPDNEVFHERIFKQSLDKEGFEPLASQAIEEISRKVDNIMVLDEERAAAARDLRWKQLNDDWVPGEKDQRDDVSHVILIRREVPADETPQEREYREFYLDTQRFFHDFWDKHNRRYEHERKLFVAEVCKHAPKGVRSGPAPEHWSSFYRAATDRSHRDFDRFNREWYGMLRRLTWLEIRASLSRLRIRLFSR